MCNVLKGLLQNFFAGVTYQLAESSVDFEPTSIQCDQCFANGSVLKSARETLFTKLKSGFRLLALADFPNGAGHQRAFLSFERAQADLNREFVAIFVEAVELQTLSHRSDAGLSEESRPIFRVLARVPLRHK